MGEIPYFGFMYTLQMAKHLRHNSMRREWTEQYSS
uniref:Uncharacterized protein n=1 Tax=Anguilla anguilla TaxID=7936 RepID=A0A0E9V8Q4_ANGAN